MPVHVAVNCSPLQLRRAGFTEQVLDVIAGWTGGGHAQPMPAAALEVLLTGVGSK